MLKYTLLILICLSALFVGSGIFAAQTPTVNAGPDLFVNSNQSITLQGSANDPDNTTLTYYWNCSGGSLSASNVIQPTFTAPNIVQYNNQMAYLCSLTATNTSGLSATDTMTVFVNYSGSNGSFYAETRSTTGISGNQATLNGYFAGSGSPTTYAWFQWGTTSSYGYTTNQQQLGYSGTFSQNIANLTPGSTYHYRAVAQNNSGTVYGSDMSFYPSIGGGIISPTNSTLSVSKSVINLTSRNLNWASSVNAKPGDILSFAITLQAGNQNVNNIVVRDILPAGLIYKGNLTINATLSNSDPTLGLNVGTIPANEICVIAFQAQVVSYGNYGINTLTNTATITSNETGTQTATATIMINNTGTLGATDIATGSTNYFLIDSFLLPMFLIIFMSWLYFTGRVYRFADYLGEKIK